MLEVKMVFFLLSARPDERLSVKVSKSSGEWARDVHLRMGFALVSERWLSPGFRVVCLDIR
jgi:hypothetical protein